MSVPAQVVQWVDRHFPKPRVDPSWLQGCYEWLVHDQQLSPTDAFPEFMEHVKEQLLESDLADSMLSGTGLDGGISQATTKLHGPPVLVQIVAITEIGVSAFQLEQVRVAREERTKAGIGNIEGEEDGDVEVEGEGPMPKYPRGTLRFRLSDGQTIINAMEYRPLPQLTLGNTELGYKMQLKGTRIQNGMAFLEPATVDLLGGKYSELEEAQLGDLKNGLRARLGRPITPEPAPGENSQAHVPAQVVRSPLREISPPPVPDIVQQHTDDIDMEPRRRIPVSSSMTRPTVTSPNQARPIAPLPSRHITANNVDDEGAVGPSRAQRATLVYAGSKDAKTSTASRYFDPTTNRTLSKSNRDMAINAALKDLEFATTPTPRQLLREIPSSSPSHSAHENNTTFDFELLDEVGADENQILPSHIDKGKAPAQTPLFLPDTPPAELQSDDYAMADDDFNEEFWEVVDQKVLEKVNVDSSEVSKARNTMSSGIASITSSSVVSASRTTVPVPSRMPVDVIEIDDSDEDMDDAEDKENQPVPARHVRQRMSNDTQAVGRGFGLAGPPLSQRTGRPVVLATNADDIIDLSDSD